MYGGRISLLIGFLAAFTSGGFGTIIGLTAGYFGGWKEDVLMRITDIVLVIPRLPLMLVLSALLGTSFWNIIFVISITTWTGTARIVRAQVLTLKERAFIESSKAIGASDLRIIGVHLLPNVFPLILAQMVLGIGGAILQESALSFLGLGDPLSISWGMILHWAFSAGALSSNYWWFIIPPGICITLVALGFTFVGYALDQIVNPRIRSR
jgi:peptide/nickel transport system permease protein